MTTELTQRSFEMYTSAGNKAVASLLKKIKRKIQGSTHLTKREINEFIYTASDKVAEKYPEIYDTEPRGHIEELTNQFLKEAGYNYEFLY